MNIALASEAEVYVDGRLVAETPLTRPLEVPSGVHVFAIAKNGKKAWSQELELQRAKTVTLEPKLATSTQRTVSFTMLGVGGAAIVAGGVSMILAFSTQSKAQGPERQARSGAASRLGPRRLQPQDRST